MTKTYRLMARVIRDYKKIQITMVLIMLAVYITLEELAVVPSLAAFPIAVACFVIMIYATKGYLRHGFRQIGRYLTDDCDPAAHTDAYVRLIAQVEKGGTMRGGWLWMRMATGLILAGRTKDALAAIKKSPALPKEALHRQSDVALMLVYHNNLFSVYLDMKDMDNAAQQLALFEKALAHLKRGKARDKMTRNGERMVCAFRMANGDYEGVQALFTAALDAAEDRLTRVSAQLALGKIYAYAGQMDKSRAAF